MYNKHMKTKIYNILLLALCFCGAAQASEKYTLEIHGLSKHYGADREYNEKNYGLGLVILKGNSGVAIGMYRNSLYRMSGYASYVVTKRMTKNILTGVDIGLITGYTDGLAPMIVPFLAVEATERVLLKFRALPAIQGITPPEISISLGLNF